jgi:glycerophosphoryl diester phosphodiesterase
LKITLWLTLTLGSLFLSSCSILTESDAVEFGNDSELKDSLPLSAAILQQLVGNYRAETGTLLFRGKMTIISANSRLTLISHDAETYAVLNAGCRNNNVIFEGKTHDPASQTVGLIRLRIKVDEGGADICAGIAPATHVRYTGLYGSNPKSLFERISLDYVGPLKSTGNLYIIGHHGCRTVDNCGASENSLEGIKYAGYLGSNAVEIDVHMSKDGVPFLYHDDDFNSRLTSGIFCLGDVTNYTMLMVKVFCRLKYGENLPTLRETLEAMLTDDTLKMIWIDPKSTDAVSAIVALANEYQTKAQTAGKTLEILIGLPDEDYVNAYKASSGYTTTKCLVEYSVPVAQELGCRAYGPRFTLGPQPADAATMQASGNLIFYWTLNDESLFDSYLNLGAANGMISDRTFLLYTYFQK